MDENVQHENGRHKQDMYKSLPTQWMIPPQLMKDPHGLTMKFMNIIAERDAAIQERNLALSEKRAALAERDMAITQRDAAIAERNNAVMERDNAVANLDYRDNNSVNGSNGSACPPECKIPRGMKHMHHQPIIHPSHLNKSPYSLRDIPVSDALPISMAFSEVDNSPRAKRMKGVKASPSKESKAFRKGKRGSEDMNNQVTVAQQNGWIGQCSSGSGSGEDLNKHQETSKPDWKIPDLGLNQVSFDDSSMPTPGCSCTGILHQCYKWGKGGWQSACCTTIMSVYPLPLMPDKRHARIGGRKMSGSAFTKLLSRLAAEGHDLSLPLDLKDHWAKHGTNRYITIK